VAAGAALGLALAFIWVGRASRGDGIVRAKVAVNGPAETTPPAAVTPPPVVTPPPPPVVAKAVEPEAAPDKQDKQDKTDGAETAEAADEKGTEAKSDTETVETTARTKSSRGPAAGGAAEKRLLAEGERMLRAERFAEARGIFEKLTKSKRERGPALVGLAEVSFQEKKYADAARAAELASEHGGGVKARVLLGDAHFRLARYKEAARAYEDALKLDPGNASAKSGLALANKRM
jgi:tetratricopeptide (TPR) repeat protein